MVLRMPGPWKHPNGVYYFRKVVPEQLRAALDRREVRISLGTRDPEEARLLYLDVAAGQQRVWLAARADAIAAAVPAAGPTPLKLTTKQIHGLAGEMYREIVAEHESEPGTPERWTRALAAMRMALPPDQREPGARPIRGVAIPVGHTAIRRFGPEVDAFLARRGTPVDAETRYRLAGAAATAIAQASRQLRRHADGDYSPDPQANRFPPVELPPAELPLDYLFAAWKGERKPKPKTEKRYLGVLNGLAAFLGTRNVLAITVDDMFRWKQHRIDLKMDPGTIKRIDLAVPKAIFGWAKGERLMPSNPAADVNMMASAKAKLRESGYTLAEARRVLAATLLPVSGRLSGERAASRRWVPWLCCYTGARVNEMTQARGDDVYREPVPDAEPVWVIRITPEAGSVKTDVARVVPLHPHLLEQGFVDYAKSRGAAPLFYDPGRARGGTPAHRQSDKSGEKLAEWIRKEVGITDAGIMPNHAWRHRFRTIGRSLKVPGDVLNALDGHAAESVADKYGDFWPQTLYEAIVQFPRYDIDGPDVPGAR
jgi:integrase